MKAQNFWVALLLLLFIAAISSCAKNQASPPVHEGIKLRMGPSTTYTSVRLPAWIFTTFEEGQYICIIRDAKRKKMPPTDAAKMFAAISDAINHSAFFPDTSLVHRASDGTINYDIAKDITMPIKQDTETQKQRLGSYIALAETAWNDYRIVLLGSKPIPVNNDLIEVSAAALPRWCRILIPTTDKESVYAVGKAENGDLIEAWHAAHRNAANKIAIYKTDAIYESMKAAKTDPEQKALIEKTLHDIDASIYKIWFYRKVHDEVPIYTVFIQLKAKKQL